MQPEDIDFLIIGAAKSATTWLQKSLQSDPSVSMPDPELHYFSRHHERGEAWYLDQFTKGERHRLLGEKSNSYLDDPRSPPRVHALLPHVKLIVQLRNPVDRAYSDYCMLYRRGEVGRDIGTHLAPAKGAGNRFLSGGLYRRQLDAYLALYPRDRLLILFYEEMLRDPASQLDRARAFLGLPAVAPATIVQKKVKDRTEPMVGPQLRKAMKPFKRLVRPFRSHPMFIAARGALVGEVAYPPLTPELRAELHAFYAPEIDQLGMLAQRDLSAWGSTGMISTSLEQR